jgi:hypothetical protein
LGKPTSILPRFENALTISMGTNANPRPGRAGTVFKNNVARRLLNPYFSPNLPPRRPR